ncbi:MAG: F0F1 ATP synthase subunit epsilon [Phycisphaeraceae bacterium]|nr:MAG: F0F1 ATP synthase subunit epsilon [Phycisphaeraceae bacterium]
MSDRTFRCRVVTPAECLLDEPVEYANVPLWDGLMGFQHGRAPIVAKLGVGELKLHFPEATHGGGDRTFFIDGGFAQMSDGDLIILAEHAQSAETIAESDAQAELDAAEKLALSPDASDKAHDADRIRKARERARVRLRIARHSRAKGI